MTLSGVLFVLLGAFGVCFSIVFGVGIAMTLVEVIRKKAGLK